MYPRRGIQHLSALCSNTSLAKMVNVISSNNERSDFYSIAADFASERTENEELTNNQAELSQISKILTDRL